MKILLVTGSYPPMKCGVGAYTQCLAKALASHDGVRVTVFTDSRSSGPACREGVEVLPQGGGWRFAALLALVRCVLRLAPDVVHIQYPTQGYTGNMPKLLPLLMRLLGVPCVQTWHESIPGKGGLWMAKGLDALVTVRPELLDILPEATRLAVIGKPFSLIASASMLPTVVLADRERRAVRGRYAAEDAVILAYYGFVAPLKGLETLLQCVARSDVRLVMACDLNPDDPYHRSLLEMIEGLGISSRVSVTGFLPDHDLARLLAAADAVVLPFRDGAQDCNTSIDGAVAQGSFVLTTSTLRSGYHASRNVYYAKPGDVEEMIAAIRSFAGTRGAATEPYAGWRGIADRHLTLYREVRKR